MFKNKNKYYNSTHEEPYRETLFDKLIAFIWTNLFKSPNNNNNFNWKMIIFLLVLLIIAIFSIFNPQEFFIIFILFIAFIAIFCI